MPCVAFEGDTRRSDIERRGANLTEKQRIENKLEAPPELIIPVAGLYLWDWFAEINNSVDRIKDGTCSRIPPAEWLAWAQLNGYSIYPQEFSILRAMDNEYCIETNKELIANRERHIDEQKRESERQNRKRR